MDFSMRNFDQLKIKSKFLLLVVLWFRSDGNTGKAKLKSVIIPIELKSKLCGPFTSPGGGE